MRIIFFGTPNFAVASLRALVTNNFNVVAVVTAPDKLAGRGMKLQESAVKKYAVENNINVLQPTNLKDAEFTNILKELRADIQIVVAFRMLPEIVWNMPKMGTINVHASLLPQYRGAAPINWAIINGESSTGVTTFKLKHEIDTGNILLQKEIKIEPFDNAGTLHDKLMIAGAELLIKTLTSLQDETCTSMPQLTNEVIQHAPKLNSKNCLIDWNRTCKEVNNHIRGLSPYPAAYTFLNQKQLKIYQARTELATHVSPPGKYYTDGKTYLKYSTQDGFVIIDELQLEGKKRMKVEDFLRGYNFSNKP